MTLDLRPKPGAAPWSKRLIRHMWMELRLLSRQGEQLMITVFVPLLGLVLGSRAGSVLDTAEPLALIFPGIIALAIVSMAFTSLAIGTGFERRYGVLKHLGATPLSPQGLVWGKALAIVVAEIIQGILLFTAAVILGWRALPGTPWWAFLCLVLLATMAFAGFALLLAGAFRAEITLALANLLFVLALAFGGLILPSDRLPSVLAPLVAYSPTGAIGDGLRTVLLDGSIPWLQMVVLAAWAVVTTVACVRWFRWE